MRPRAHIPKKKEKKRENKKERKELKKKWGKKEHGIIDLHGVRYHECWIDCIKTVSISYYHR
jgi:hypothetical protein